MKQIKKEKKKLQTPPSKPIRYGANAFFKGNSTT
jgi:hypothetical protein